MKEDIINKLDIFLTENKIISKEYQVVYIMVEIRKILDLLKKLNTRIEYQLLRFYCDWIVHIQKDNITREMKYIMEQVEKSFIIEKNTPRLAYNSSFRIFDNFITGKILRLELLQFINEFNISNNFCTEFKNWPVFFNSLINILTDQPINNPTDKIEFFRYHSVKVDRHPVDYQIKRCKIN